MKQTKLFVITISRELGSGGAFIGQQLAEKLNIFFADREIIHKAAKELSALEEDLESREEKMLSFWETFLKVGPFAQDAYVPPRILEPTDRELFETEARIISNIVKKHSAVIIGRCGFDILRDHPNHLSVFLHADKATRNKRLQELYEISKTQADEMIEKSDKDRAVYCKTFTGKEWANSRNYDISINAGKLGIDNTVELILSYLNLNPQFDIY